VGKWRLAFILSSMELRYLIRQLPSIELSLELAALCWYLSVDAQYTESDDHTHIYILTPVSCENEAGSFAEL